MSISLYFGLGFPSGFLCPCRASISTTSRHRNGTQLAIGLGLLPTPDPDTTEPLTFSVRQTLTAFNGGVCKIPAIGSGRRSGRDASNESANNAPGNARGDRQRSVR